MQAGLGRIVLYTKRIEEMTDFYCRLFGYHRIQLPGDRIVELSPASQGIPILLHAAAKGQKEGQACVKLVFDVKDVIAFTTVAADKGYPFGPIHKGDGYAFANRKDPAGNSVSVSSRFNIQTSH